MAYDPMSVKYVTRDSPRLDRLETHRSVLHRSIEYGRDIQHRKTTKIWNSNQCDYLNSQLSISIISFFGRAWFFKEIENNNNNN
ncbi:hypothetical protein NPIL_655431 [Nephila pilipes]|uniref:Uncharacterized protein n=1 Tax=Nephila pilipes TaxID=299642 RepID=A0A8X6K7C7_NEPPI|nr:hypothetical protein NPIL_655431 [Nephila pilipes]